MNAELIKKLRILGYHTEDIKIMREAADALEAADRRTHFLTDNDYPAEGERVLFWDVDNQQWVSGYYDAPHWEADYGRVDAFCWQPLPQPPQKGE